MTKGFRNNVLFPLYRLVRAQPHTHTLIHARVHHVTLRDDKNDRSILARYTCVACDYAPLRNTYDVTGAGVFAALPHRVRQIVFDTKQLRAICIVITTSIPRYFIIKPGLLVCFVADGYRRRR